MFPLITEFPVSVKEYPPPAIVELFVIVEPVKVVLAPKVTASP